ncbi:hypothetical protein KHA80_21115 [Anaerobacillus sp. HL2]|nr:hypothetical protein KHA80_21115 [Anaerobacillus sp. HL2]
MIEVYIDGAKTVTQGEAEGVFIAEQRSCRAFFLSLGEKTSHEVEFAPYLKCLNFV